MHDGSADFVVDAIHQNKKMKSVALENTSMLHSKCVLVFQKPLIANNGDSTVAISGWGRVHHVVMPVLEILVHDGINVNSIGLEHITPSIADDGVDGFVPVTDLIIHFVAGDVVLPCMESAFLSKLLLIETHGIAPNGKGKAALLESINIFVKAPVGNSDLYTSST
jgi:hypothetical protein